MDRSNGELLSIVRADLREVLGVTASLELVRINRLPRAMPQYAVGHLGLLWRIDACLSSLPTISLAGAGYKGVGIPDCIRSGETAADRVLAALRDAAQRQQTGTTPPFSLPPLNDRVSRSIFT